MRLRVFVRALFHRTETDRELDEELRFHLEQDARRLVAGGAASDEAEFRARRAFGNLGVVREAARDAWRWAPLERLGQDISYAMRTLQRSPGFTIVAILSLALGIGANAGIFSVVNAVLLRPLPYDDPDRLVSVWERETRAARQGGDRSEVAPANLADWQSESRSFVGLAAYSQSRAALTGPGDPMEIATAYVSPPLLGLVGIRPIAGRMFLPDEAQAGNNSVAVISSGLWRRRFGGDLRLIGQTVAIDGQSYRVVGILPSEHAFPEETELWRPLASAASPTRGAHFLQVVGRLRPGVSLVDARAELGAIAVRLEQAYPATNLGQGITLVSLREVAVGPVRRPLLVLFGAVGFVLLVACTNVGGLLLARAAARGPEMALRTALGAGRARLVQQLLTEGVVLSLLGAAIGLLLAVWISRLILALSPVSITAPSGPVSLDGRVVLFTLGLSILTGMGFSLAPALRASAPNLRDALQSGGRQAFSGTSTVRIRRLLVCAELALTTVLVTGAGLMVRSLLRLERVDLGFSPANILTTEIRLPGSRYPGGTRRAAAFYDQLTRALGAATGVQSAGAVYMLPLAGDNRVYSFRKEGRPDESLQANFRVATRGYFRTIGAPILRGRDFANGDSAGGSRVVLINELMAQRFWPGEDALGKRIAIRGETVPREVVGIVRDVRHFGPDVLPEPEMYVPHAEVAVNDMSVVIRTSGDPLRMAGMLEAQVHALDKDLPLATTRTMGQLFDRSLALRRFALQLLSAFAIGALLLSCIGVYGLVAYSIAQRRQEIGVRMALGAGRLHVLRLLASEIIRLATSGILAGLLGAWLLGRVLSSLLFQTSPTDPVSLVVAAVSLLVVALGACAFPTLKATRMNPATAMRNL